MASIRKRGDQQWEARIRRKGQPLTCRTFSTKTQAELWARQLEAEMDRGVFVSRTEAERTTLREALERYTVDYLPKLKSAAKETIRARAIGRRSIADKPLAAIRSHDIARLRDTLAAESLAAHSIRLDLALLSRLFNVAHREWGMESLGNPVTQVSKPRLPPGRDRRLQGDEEARLLATCTEGGRSPWMVPLVQLALETAMRQGELLALCWAQVDLTRRVALLLDTKNGERRQVPLSPVALALLKTLPHDPSGRVFPLTQSAVEQAWRRACTRAGITGLRFHDLRHEATSRLFEKGLNLMEAAAVTGHKTLQMLKRYTHLKAEDLAAKL